MMNDIPPFTPLLAPPSTTDETLLRAIQIMQSIVDHQTRFDSEIGEIKDTMHSIDKRMAVLETSTLERDLQSANERLNRHSERIRVLETDKERRDGAVSSLTWIGNNWAWIAAFVALATIYVTDLPDKLVP